VLACTRRDGLHRAGEPQVCRLSADGSAPAGSIGDGRSVHVASDVLCTDAETAAPGRKGNSAQTIQIGNANQVFQSQSGGNNVSNVGIWGGKDNDVGVWQGGRDLSNLNLINTQGLSIAVLQPPGSTPFNVLIARLPNGSLLIKR